MDAAEERDWLTAARATGGREAIEPLLDRFGPVVMGTCRRMLGDDEAATSEAFQATFLLLLRGGRTLGRRGDLGAWLHRAACRVAERTRGGRVAAACRNRRVDLAPLVDEAVDRLWVGRTAVVVRDLMGLSRSEAAARLGFSRRGLDWRLGFARRAIDARLRRAADRALRSGRAAIAGCLSLEALRDVEVPTACRVAVVRDAARLAGDREWNDQVSAEVSELARTVLAGLIVARFRKIATATFLVGILGAGASFAALHRDDRPASPPAGAGPPPGPPAAAPPSASERVVKLAAGARAETLRTDLIDSARKSYREAAEGFRLDHGSIEAVDRTSRILLDAELDGATPGRRKSALAEHRARMADLVRRALLAPSGEQASPLVARARTMLAEAQLWEARDGPEPVAAEGRPAGRADDGTSASVLARLDEVVPMDFPRPTPLGEVLDRIRLAAKGTQPDVPAFPLYVDPVGLKRAGVDLASPVTIAVEGVPLRQSLQLLLRQLNLTSYVEDGVLIVTAASDAVAGSSPLDKERQRAAHGEMSIAEMKVLAEKVRLLGEIQSPGGERP